LEGIVTPLLYQIPANASSAPAANSRHRRGDERLAQMAEVAK